MSDFRNQNTDFYFEIVAACDEFLAGKISLQSVTQRLEGAISNLVDLNDKEKNQFLSNWGVLEDLYAIDLDDPSKLVLSTYATEIDAATNEIKRQAVSFLER
jgi:hypothetical protein